MNQRLLLMRDYLRAYVRSQLAVETNVSTVYHRGNPDPESQMIEDGLYFMIYDPIKDRVNPLRGI